jgi:fatty acid desaturase
MLEFAGTLCIGSSLLSRAPDLGLVFILLPYYILFKKRMKEPKSTVRRSRLKAFMGWIFQAATLVIAIISALILLVGIVSPLMIIQYAVNFAEAPFSFLYLWLLHLARPLGLDEDTKQSVRNRLRDARLGTFWTPGWIKGDMLKVIDKASEEVDSIVPKVIGRQIPFVGLVGVVLVIVGFVTS